MQTRRTVLKNALAFPFGASLGGFETPASRCEIVSEPTCLSQESAQGFESVISEARSNLIVLAAASAVTSAQANDLAARARAGAWVVWEASPSFPSSQLCERQFDLLRSEFGIVCGNQFSQSGSQYVRYVWPHIALTRTFLACAPLADECEGVIAHYAAHAVAAKRALGRGGIVFLGSMLGPHLQAGDREAVLIARHIFEMLG